MNDLNDFVSRWNAMRAQWDGKPDKFEHLPPGDYPFLNADELRLLQQIGLPQGNPVFSFDEIVEGMPRVDELYGMNDEAEREYWVKIDREQIARYRMMGQDGGGNPVVFDVESREILLLDHEAMFVPAELINSSLNQLYQSLLLMAHAAAQAPADVDVGALQAQIKEIDPQVTEEAGYWHDYASCLPDFD